MTRNKPATSKSELERLRAAILPAIAEISIGNFDVQLELPDGESAEFREVVAGVQVLLETIREKAARADMAREELARTQAHTAEMLDKILRGSLRHDA